jgi:hypothetical protein
MEGWKTGTITGMKLQSPENSGETYSAEELRGTEFTSSAKLIKPSAFGGITPSGREKVVRLTPETSGSMHCVFEI